MKISFVVPVYNVEQYVSFCIESILNQIDVFPGSEIIVVNDGSNDNSMQMLEKFSADSHMIFLHQKNQGLSVARNNGCQVATGDYVWFVDSDDWLATNALETLKNTMEKFPDMDVYATGLIWDYPSGLKEVDMHQLEDVVYSGQDYFLKGFMIGASPRFIQKRSFIKKHNLQFIPNVLHEDGPYGCLLCFFAESIKIVSEPLYHYRQRSSENIMSSISIKNTYDIFFWYRYLLDYGKKNIDSSRLDLFNYFAYKMMLSLFDFSKPFFDTDEFKLFMKDAWPFIKVQVHSLSYYRNFKERITRYLFLANPILYFKYFIPFCNFVFRHKK